jgi:hypothetical protein
MVIFVATPQIRYFRYQRPIQNTPQQAVQTCVVLDPAIFAHAAPQLTDLRLYQGDAETPYVIHRDAPVEAADRPIALLNLGRRDGQIVFDAAMPEGTYSDLQLPVTARDFIATVTVYGSQSSAERPQTKLGIYTIFDFTRQRLGRSTVLHLPPSNFPYLHLSITGPLRPDEVAGLSIARLPGSLPQYQTVTESSLVQQKGRTSIIEFTVPAHVPIDRVSFTPAATPAQFSRDVTVSVAPASPPSSDDREPPQPVTSYGNLLRVHSNQSGHRIDEEHLAVDAPPESSAAPSKWTITINNGDDAPLNLQSVRLQMIERKLCFQADGNASYMLFYGDPALSAPQYDYARLFTLQANAAVAAAGPEQLNPNYQPRPDQRPFTERHPILLWFALIAVIASLGFIGVRSARQFMAGPH